MDDDKLQQLVRSSQQGDQLALEILIEYFRPFVRQTAHGICRRPLEWENSDELSVALIAFNEAVAVFDPARGAGFATFARRVISQRLIDYFRKEKRHIYVPLDTEEWDAKHNRVALSLEEYHRKTEQEQLAETMLEFDRLLTEYGTSLDELADICPRHRDTRERLVYLAQMLSADEQLLSSFHRTKRLPATEVSRKFGVSKRILEKGRKYLAAMVIILSEERFSELRSFIELD